MLTSCNRGTYQRGPEWLSATELLGMLHYDSSQASAVSPLHTDTAQIINTLQSIANQISYKIYMHYCHSSQTLYLSGSGSVVHCLHMSNFWKKVVLWPCETLTRTTNVANANRLYTKSKHILFCCLHSIVQVCSNKVSP